MMSPRRAPAVRFTLIAITLALAAAPGSAFASGGAPNILDSYPQLKPRKILEGKRPILVVVRSVTVRGALRGLIAADIQTARDRVERCADGVPSRRLVSGRVVTRLYVNGHGRVYARVVRSGLRLPKVRRCIARTLRKMRLPKMYAVSRVSVTFDFKDRLAELFLERGPRLRLATDPPKKKTRRSRRRRPRRSR